MAGSLMGIALSVVAGGRLPSRAGKAAVALAAVL